MKDWNECAKRILKTELVKRGLSNSDLVRLLNDTGENETKAAIDSKISRGSFSASFFLQSLSVIGCAKIEIEDYHNSFLIAAEPMVNYDSSKDGK